MKFKFPDIDRKEVIKWLLFGGVALVIILVLVYGIKKIRSWFGLDDGKENKGDKEEKDVNLKIDIEGDVSGLLVGFDKKIVRYVKRLREVFTETYMTNISRNVRCQLYSEILTELTKDELKILGEAYEAAYDENLTDRVKKMDSGCWFWETDFKKKLLEELKGA